MFTKSVYFRYDLTIGTSDRGNSIEELSDKQLKYNHTLIVFGGLHGIEAALENDEQLKEDEASLLFNHYINVLPSQGSRTIRTEEAILIALSGLRNKLQAINEPMVFKETGIAPSSVFPPTKVNNAFDNSNSEINLDLSRFD